MQTRQTHTCGKICLSIVVTSNPTHQSNCSIGELKISLRTCFIGASGEEKCQWGIGDHHIVCSWDRQPKCRFRDPFMGPIQTLQKKWVQIALCTFRGGTISTSSLILPLPTSHWMLLHLWDLQANLQINTNTDSEPSWPQTNWLPVTYCLSLRHNQLKRKAGGKSLIVLKESIEYASNL